LQIFLGCLVAQISYKNVRHSFPLSGYLVFVGAALDT
jgi:hypothetical protein